MNWQAGAVLPVFSWFSPGRTLLVAIACLLLLPSCQTTEEMATKSSEEILMPVMQLSLAVGAYRAKNGVVPRDLADLARFTEKYEGDEQLLFDPTMYNWITCTEAGDGTIEILHELSGPSGHKEKITISGKRSVPYPDERGK